MGTAVDVPSDKQLAEKYPIDKYVADKAELLRGFANLIAESKPLTVSTDLKQFGYELFAGAPTTFAPATDIPVPAEYVLALGMNSKFISSVRITSS